MEWLNYHHLRYFWTVAKEGGLARAAEKMRVSQPSISAQIRALELVLDEKLFRRVGRKNVLTDAGQIVFNYADEIFALGRELVSAVKQRPTAKALRFYVGIADSFPKLVTEQILSPVFSMRQQIQVICREGKMQDLLGQLAAYRLDLVLADEPPSSSTNFTTFHHPLGESGTSFCAAGPLAARLKRNFPKSLHEAPAFLPADNTALRRELESWFRAQRVTPHVIAEFEDLAMMNVMAAGGRGFTAIPTVAAEEAEKRFGFRVIGAAKSCRVRFHAITAERRILHPAANAITAAAERFRRHPAH